MRKRPLHGGGGFTLTELLVVSVLMAWLTLMTAQMWRYFSSEMADLAGRARVAQELRFAVESICQGMGATVGAVVVEDDRITFCKDAGAQPDGVPNWTPPDIMVEYYLSNGQLVSYETTSGSQIVIADSVSQFAVRNVTESVLEMVIGVQRGDVQRQVTLLWSKP